MQKSQADELAKHQLENLAKRLKALRIEKGYTSYEKFAFDNELSRTQYARYEQGKDIKFTTLVKISAGLGISISELFAEGFEETISFVKK